jgi:hypothetical protein
MSQKPKMAQTFFPGIIGSISPPRFMFSAMTADPASPNPTARRPQIFAMEFSSSRVSICVAPAASPPSFTSNLRSGFSLTSRTFFTIRSIGFSTNSFASRLNISAPRPRTTHTNAVRATFSALCVRVSARASKNAYDTLLSDRDPGAPGVTAAANRNSSHRSAPCPDASSAKSKRASSA